ncbi:Virus viroplasmin [Balamuthia mandrillaris]
MGKTKPKWYAVAEGRRPGVYRSWADCEDQVKGFSGAKYKSFATEAEAEDYLQSHARERLQKESTIQAFLKRKRGSVGASNDDATTTEDLPGVVLETGPSAKGTTVEPATESPSSSSSPAMVHQAERKRTKLIASPYFSAPTASSGAASQQRMTLSQFFMANQDLLMNKRTLDKEWLAQHW